MQLMKLSQSFAGNMRINLCSRNVRMSEQHLHDPKIGAVIEQMGGKCMSDRVR